MFGIDPLPNKFNLFHENFGSRSERIERDGPTDAPDAPATNATASFTLISVIR
jgi:hypothetical protein